MLIADRIGRNWGMLLITVLWTLGWPYKILFKSKNHLLLFAKYMKTRHRNLKFTFDFEQNNSFSFLDVKITRGINRFSTSVFRKATFSGVFTNFDSFIFESYKTDLIFTLLFRCFTICSDMQSFHLEIEKLRQIFKFNNYPVSLFYSLLWYAKFSFRSGKTATGF